MKLKRISIRFILENDVERKVWEYLQCAKGSKNSAVISAVNVFFEPDTLSEDENSLMDTLDEFLGG